jgi:thioredoxin 1
MTTLIASLLTGAGLGALLGRFGRCASGSCALTANWRRGAVFGAAIGFMVYLAANGSHQPSKNIKAITDAEFDAEVTRAGAPVVVDFFATWCGPCRTLAPRLDKLAGEFGGRIKFVSVNVDQSPALAEKFNVRGVPTLIFIGRDGQVVETSVGLLPAETLRAKLEALAAK